MEDRGDDDGVLLAVECGAELVVGPHGAEPLVELALEQPGTCPSGFGGDGRSRAGLEPVKGAAQELVDLLGLQCAPGGLLDQGLGLLDQDLLLAVGLEAQAEAVWIDFDRPAPGGGVKVQQRAHALPAAGEGGGQDAGGATAVALEQPLQGRPGGRGVRRAQGVEEAVARVLEEDDGQEKAHGYRTPQGGEEVKRKRGPGSAVRGFPKEGGRPLYGPPPPEER